MEKVRPNEKENKFCGNLKVREIGLCKHVDEKRRRQRFSMKAGNNTNRLQGPLRQNRT